MPRATWIRRLHRAIALSLALGLIAPPAPGALATPASDAVAEDHVPDELLVGFHDHVTSPEAEALYRAEGAAKLEKLRRVNVHRIRLSPAVLRVMEQRLRHRPEVVFVERNRRIRAALVPNDPVYDQQWHT
jgi:hypothetical protein